MGTVLLVCVSPILSMLLSFWIASLFGCQLDEGSVHVCTVAGRDIGEALYGMMVVAWLGIVSAPFGLGFVMVYLAVLGIRRLTRRTFGAKG